MRDFINDILARTELNQIMSFVLHGAETYERGSEPYKVQIQKGSDAIYKRLESIFPNETALEEAHADLSQALGSYETVYTEIGMKVGARIIYQLLIAEK